MNSMLVLMMCSLVYTLSVIWALSGVVCVLQCKLELKPLEPVYRDVRVVIPQLESSMSVEYDQFSTVGDVLHQVLSLADPPLQATEGYSLYHVRLRMQ